MRKQEKNTPAAALLEVSQLIYCMYFRILIISYIKIKKKPYKTLFFNCYFFLKWSSSMLENPLSLPGHATGFYEWINTVALHLSLFFPGFSLFLEKNLAFFSLLFPIRPRDAYSRNKHHSCFFQQEILSAELSCTRAGREAPAPTQTYLHKHVFFFFFTIKRLCFLLVHVHNESSIFYVRIFCAQYIEVRSLICFW